MQYLKKLLARVEKISMKNLIPPSVDRNPEDKFVGTLPDALKKLWTAKELIWEQVMLLDKVGQEKFSHLQEEERAIRKDEIMAHYHNYMLSKNEANLLENCFWASVRECFPQILCSNIIGLRRGWQVVEVDETKKFKRDLKDFVDNFLKEIDDE